MSQRLKEIPLLEIRANEVALREVDREGEGYKELVGSIRSQGVLASISVRERRDEKTRAPYYEIIDGLHRFTASAELGLETIPAMVLDKTDAEVAEAQIVANVQRIETKPGDYTKGLLRILSMNPRMTEAELATTLGKSPTWINARLSLMKLDAPILELVNEGKIVLANAFPLAKLPKEEQTNWVERAMTQSVQEFSPACLARSKEIKEANRKGEAADRETFKATAYMRKLTEIEGEYNNPSVGPALIAEQKPQTFEEAFQLAIAWTISLDPASQTAAKAKHEERLKKETEAKARRDAEKTAARAKEAAERQGKLQKEAEEKKAAAEKLGIDLSKPVLETAGA